MEVLLRARAGSPGPRQTWPRGGDVMVGPEARMSPGSVLSGGFPGEVPGQVVMPQLRCLASRGGTQLALTGTALVVGRQRDVGRKRSRRGGGGVPGPKSQLCH